MEEVIELLEYPKAPQDDDISIEDLLTARQRRRPALLLPALCVSSRFATTPRLFPHQNLGRSAPYP
jgi:hypothetical protein